MHITAGQKRFQGRTGENSFVINSSRLFGTCAVLWSGILLTPWSRVLIQKPIVIHLVKKFPAFHGNRSFINKFTRVHQYFLSWARCIPSYFTKFQSNIILPSTPGSRQWITTKILYTFIISHMRTICPAHLIIGPRNEKAGLNRFRQFELMLNV